MKISLYSEKTIGELKRDFNALFPHLKIEFFHHFSEANAMKPRAPLPASLPLTDISGVLREGEIEISPQDTISKIESSFQLRFGLPARIYQRYGSTWVEPSRAISQTLEGLDEMGRHSFRPVPWDIREGCIL